MKQQKAIAEFVEKIHSGKIKNEISIETPKGIMFDAQIVDISREETSVACSVVKDGGDDPDVTTGSHVRATVSYNLATYNDVSSQSIEGSKIMIDGGVGVGRVTKPGLDQPVGNAAINSVPREMIAKEVREVVDLCDYTGSLNVIISVL